MFWLRSPFVNLPDTTYFLNNKFDGSVNIITIEVSTNCTLDKEKP